MDIVENTIGHFTQYYRTQWMSLAVEMVNVHGEIQLLLVLGVTFAMSKPTGGVTVAFRKCVKAALISCQLSGPSCPLD